MNKSIPMLLVAAVSMVLLILAGCEEWWLPQETESGRGTEEPQNEPERPEPESTELKTRDVNILSKSQLESDLLAVAEDSLSFSQPVSYETGEFIAAEISAKTPYGILREVTSVSADRKTVMTVEATLEDAIERGTVRISGTLSPDDLTTASRAALAESGMVARGGGGLGPAAAGQLSFGYDLSATDGSSTLSGRVDFALGYELIAKYDHGLKDMRFSITSKQVFSVEVSAKGEFRNEWQLGRTLEFSGIPVVGAPWIVFTPKLDLHAGVVGGFEASVSTRHTASVTVGAECRADCDETENWNGINESPPSQTNGVTFEARQAGHLRVFVAPRLTFDLYGRFGGPYIEAVLSIGATAEKVTADQCLRKTIDARLTGKLGGEARVSVLGVTLTSAKLDEFEFEIVDPVVLWEESCAPTGPPTGLRAIANGAHQIDLSWTAPPDAEGVEIIGYKIEVSTEGETWRLLEDNTNSLATSYSHTGLPAESTRHYRVSAIDSEGNSSEPSSPAHATTEPEAETTFAPTGLRATANGPYQIDLSWTAPPDTGGVEIIGYKIEVSTEGETWRLLEDNTNSLATSYSHTGLPAESTRHYRVSAIDSEGNSSEPSSPAHATTEPEAETTFAPTGLRATANGPYQIDLSWTAPPDTGGVEIIGYKIEVSTEGETWRLLEDNTNSLATSYSHTGLPAESTRHYRVSAIDSEGNSSEPSSPAHATTEPEAESTFRACDACPEMVVVPAGSYEMGPVSPEYVNDAYFHKPVHPVRISEAFAVGIHEVTRREFDHFVRETDHDTGRSCWALLKEMALFKEIEGISWDNPGFMQNDDEPVVCVSWMDAQAYVSWLSARTGNKYRLLSEAEWEYVARAGTKTQQYWGDSDEMLYEQCKHANAADKTFERNYEGYHSGGKYCDDGYYQTAPVGSYEANGFGLYDMSGNVAEWVEDCYHFGYTGAPTDGSAWETGNCEVRMVRGGSWVSNWMNIRPADRSWRNAVGSRKVTLGFRVAKTLKS